MDVIVPYGNGADIIERLQELDDSRGGISDLREVLEEAKQYTISVYEHQIRKLMDNGYLLELFEKRVFVLMGDAYSKKYGLEPIIQQEVENYIF